MTARTPNWLLLLTLVFAAPFCAAQTTADPVAVAIAAELDALMNPGVTTIHGARIALGERLHEFYSRREFRAAWSTPQLQSELLRTIADSEADGLNAADYHLPLLRELAAQVAAPDATATLKAQNDILLTEGLLRLAYHLSFGKVDAVSFDAQWNYGRVLPRTDVAQRIEEAITSGAIYDRVAALKPTHPLYVRMKQELARLRAMQSDWSAVPAGAKLEPGAHDERVPTYRARLVRSGDLAQAAVSDEQLYDPPLVEAVKRYQRRHGLMPDGVLGATTVAEMNVPIAKRIEQLRINLDRGRVVLHDLPERFIVVNIAAYSLYLVNGQDVVWTTRVQVGKTYRKTPLFRSEISYVVFNPTWTVPPGILKSDILPAAKRDPAAITNKGLKVLAADGSEVDPASVDWSQFKSGHIPYTLRQDPGPKNALGRVKLMFPNPYSVYLHDTPSQSLFERDERAFSSGCVRVERALELAERVLDDAPQWNPDSIAKVITAGQTQNVTLHRKMPILLMYWTAWVDHEGIVNFRHDVYDSDAKWAAALDAPFMLRAQPLYSAAPVP